MAVAVDLEVGEERIAPDVADEDRAADLQAPADEDLVEGPRLWSLGGRDLSGRFEDRIPLRIESSEKGPVGGDVVEDDLGHPGEELAGHGHI
jgi:hypothetical protein